jgi:hypothetical protein
MVAPATTHHLESASCKAATSHIGCLLKIIKHLRLQVQIITHNHYELGCFCSLKVQQLNRMLGSWGLALATDFSQIFPYRRGNDDMIKP